MSHSDPGTYWNVGVSFQCVELAQRLYAVEAWYVRSGRDKRFINVYQASDIWAQAASWGWPEQPQGAITYISPGDMIVFKASFNNGAGHVGVLDSVNGNSVTSVEENAAASGRFAYSLAWNRGSATISGSSRSSTDIYGIVHAPNNKPPAVKARTIYLTDPGGYAELDWPGGVINLDAGNYDWRVHLYFENTTVDYANLQRNIHLYAGPYSWVDILLWVQPGVYEVDSNLCQQNPPYGCADLGTNTSIAANHNYVWQGTVWWLPS